MIGDQRQHNRGLVVSIEVSPIHGHDDGGSCTDDVGHPTNQNLIDVDGWIGEQPVHLFDRMLELQTPGGGEALANGALCNTPRVALQSESTRLACRSCSSKPPRTSRTSLNENRCLMTIAFLDSVLPRGRLACCDGTGNRVRQFARICHPRRSSDSFRDHPHDRPVLLCLNENEGMGKKSPRFLSNRWGPPKWSALRLAHIPEHRRGPLQRIADPLAPCR